MNNKQIGLSFGCLSESISTQLNKQGFKYDAKKVSAFEKQADAINHLRFGLLTDSMADIIIKKLYKQIVQHVAKENKLKEVS